MDRENKRADDDDAKVSSMSGKLSLFNVRRPNWDGEKFSRTNREVGSIISPIVLMTLMTPKFNQWI